jgi:hypothetical protein
LFHLRFEDGVSHDERQVLSDLIAPSVGVTIDLLCFIISTRFEELRVCFLVRRLKRLAIQASLKVASVKSKVERADCQSEAFFGY